MGMALAGLYDELVLRVDFTIEPFIAGSPEIGRAHV